MKWINKLLDKWAIQRFKRIAVENLTITEKQVNVKKGKRRYTLLVFITPAGEVVFNINRY
ncbi:MAG: hypothetical protein KGZ97_12090 [Bacteroidetes bacterium]|nr:hypothetical protein [Bacteroidota bacterium]